jgi:Domain of unknown function (DUF6249)
MESQTMLVAVVGIVVTFGLPVLMMAIILYYKHRKARMTHETIVRLAEKGLPVPPELLDPPPRSPDTALRAGLVLLGLGLGLGLFLGEVRAPWSIGLIPGLMGVALIVSWKIEKSRQR